MNSLSINLIHLNTNNVSSEKKNMVGHVFNLNNMEREAVISIIWRERQRHLMVKEASYTTGLRAVFATGDPISKQCH